MNKISKILALAITSALAISISTLSFADDTTTAPAKKGTKKAGKSKTEQAAPKPKETAPVALFDPGPSPTLERPAPADAIVLFDGKNMDAWVHHVPKEWLTPGASCKWPIADGVVTLVPNSGSLITRELFSDFKFHAEFQTTETPTNAGFYLHSHYELKIHETYGNPNTNPCGNFGNTNSTKRPIVNAARPKGEWQTYDIQFWAPKFDASGQKTAPAHATVVLNGVKIYDNQELSGLILGAATLPENPKAPLQLKEHGNVVKYRNMWIIDMTKNPDDKTPIDGLPAAEALAKATAPAATAAK